MKYLVVKNYQIIIVNAEIFGQIFFLFQTYQKNHNISMVHVLTSNVKFKMILTLKAPSKNASENVVC